MIKKLITCIAVLGCVAFVGCSGESGSIEEFLEEKGKEVTQSNVDNTSEKLLSKHEKMIEAVKEFNAVHGGEIDIKEIDSSVEGLEGIEQIYFKFGNEDVIYNLSHDGVGNVEQLELIHSIYIDENDVANFLENGFEVRDTKFIEIQKMLTNKDLNDEALDKLNELTVKALKSEGQNYKDELDSDIWQYDDEYWLEHYVEYNEGWIMLAVIQNN